MADPVFLEFIGNGDQVFRRRSQRWYGFVELCKNRQALDIADRTQDAYGS